MIFLILLALAAVAIYIFMRQPQFGRFPTGERAQKVRASPNFRDGEFQNQHHTPQLADGVSYFTVMRKFFFGKDSRSKPDITIPTVKVDLLSLPAEQNTLVWFGHSSFYLQLDGKRFLVDPVFSGAASPVKFTTRSFPGTDVYSVDDLPDIDFLLITHDHWDHLDHETMLKLKTKVGMIITGLGTGEHLEYWGFNPSRIIELDWNQRRELTDGFTVDAVPARHFSGRTFKRNQALWVSFVLQTPSTNIFIGGDSGYDTHFKEIGEEFGPFDLALLECGQYNEYWRYIHMLPEETAQAAVDLRAERLMPVHWSKFTLALHAWDEPINKVLAEAERLGMPVLHPVIGEPVRLDSIVASKNWWVR